MLCDHNLLDKRCAVLADESRKLLEPYAQLLEQLLALSWHDIGKYGTYYGGMLVLDAIALHYFNLALSATGRKLMSTISTALEASTVPQRLVEVAGVSKVAA